LAITSNNIANAQNASYHKQSVNFSDNVQILDTTGYYGTGVSVSAISRAYSTALETSLSGAYTSDGYNQTYLEYVSQAEDLIAPEGESTLISAMSSYMKAIQDVQTNPEDETYREELISAAQTLGDALNTSFSALGVVRDGLGQGTAETDPVTGITTTVLSSGTAYDAVTDVNNILSQLTDLNEQISNLETYNSNNATANDLRDQRDALVQELSNYMGVSVSEDSHGRYTITTTDSSGNDVVLLGVKGSGTSNYQSYYNEVRGVFADVRATSAYDTLDFQVDVYDASTGTSPWTGIARTGELGAYSDSYDYLVNEMKQIYNLDFEYGYTDPITSLYVSNITFSKDAGGNISIDTGTNATNGINAGFAQSLALYTDSVFYFGYDLNSKTGGDAGFLNLFDIGEGADYAGSGSVLSVTSGFSYQNVAASDEASIDPSTSLATVVAGDGDQAGLLWTTLNSTKVKIYSSTDSSGVESTTSRTLGSYANSYVNAIAVEVQTATNRADTSEASVTMYKNAIASQSGVSTDEEVTNMLAIQNAYAASAKIITSIQAMYDAIFAVV
jgi:flagellar hook-associated protein 1 FlgK